MYKFKKGMIYLVLAENSLFYIVRQVGQRTWVAINFTHASLDWEDIFKSGNSKALLEDLNPSKVKGFGNDNAEFRREMFNILKYGEM